MWRRACRCEALSPPALGAGSGSRGFRKCRSAAPALRTGVSGASAPDRDRPWSILSRVEEPQEPDVAVALAGIAAEPDHVGQPAEDDPAEHHASVLRLQRPHVGEPGDEIHRLVVAGPQTLDPRAIRV